MALTTLLCLSVLGQSLLPGSTLSIERAKEDACYIVAARVVKTSGEVLSSSEAGLVMWTGLKLSSVLKGEVDEEGLNRLPLAISISKKKGERLPKVGEEFLIFIACNQGAFPIIKMMPMSEANVAAIQAAKPPPPEETEEGRPPVFSFGGFPKRGNRLEDWTPEPPPAYRGTHIVTDNKATGDQLKIQEDFAAAMSRSDPAPEDREAHFAYLDKNEYVRRYPVYRIGWYGGIIGTEPRPGGGWLVKVAIRPWQFSMRIRFCHVLDAVEETYEFKDGRVRLVESSAAKANPQQQVFPPAW